MADVNPDDTAADMQVAYDEAVQKYGATSHQAWVAEQEARRYFNLENQES